MKNTGKRPRATYQGFDRVYIDLPEQRGVKRFVSTPMKTIYINIAADDDGITLKIRDGEEELFDAAIM